jgi:ribosomal protein S21
MSNDYRVGRIARVRVELKRKFNDPMKNFKEMLREFHRQMAKAGIMHDYREHAVYEKDSDRERRKQRSVRKKLLMDMLKHRIIKGEKIEGHGGLVKKVRADIRRDKEKEKRLQEKTQERTQAKV